MKLSESYSKNKPLYHSIIAGILYFMFCWSLDFTDSTKGIFMALMLFLPGLTFPITTCYVEPTDIKYSGYQRILHIAASVAIYHGSVWLFSLGGKINYITVLAGIFGSLLFQFTTKFLLRKKLSFQQIALISIISGAAFLPYELSDIQGLFIGLGVLIWTITNGCLLNMDYHRNLKFKKYDKA